MRPAWRISAAVVGNYAEQIDASFHASLTAGNREHRVRVSIGAAVFPNGGGTADELLSNSHMALSRARATQRGGHVLFEEQIRRDLETRLTLEAELALAVNATNSNCSTSRNYTSPMVV